MTLLKRRRSIFISALLLALSVTTTAYAVDFRTTVTGRATELYDASFATVCYDDCSGSIPFTAVVATALLLCDTPLGPASGSVAIDGVGRAQCSTNDPGSATVTLTPGLSYVFRYSYSGPGSEASPQTDEQGRCPSAAAKRNRWP